MKQKDEENNEESSNQEQLKRLLNNPKINIVDGLIQLKLSKKVKVLSAKDSIETDVLEYPEECLLEHMEVMDDYTGGIKRAVALTCSMTGAIRASMKKLNVKDYTAMEAIVSYFLEGGQTTGET